MITKAEIARAYWDFTGIKKEKDLRSVSKEIEAYFFRVFLKEVEKSLPKGIFNSSFAGKFYFDMFTMELSKVIGEKDPLNFEEFFEKALKSYTTYAKSDK